MVRRDFTFRAEINFAVPCQGSMNKERCQLFSPMDLLSLR